MRAVRLSPTPAAAGPRPTAGTAVQASGEHEFEPVHGMPAELPAGEVLLWQGAPQWQRLAVDAFHVRKVAVYFGLLILARGVGLLAEGQPTAQVLASMATGLVWQLPLAAAGLGLLTLLAWLSARTTVYSLTNRRVVMRVGMVLSITFNLPLRQVEAAAVARGPGGSGELCLQLGGPQRIAYLHLWPHVRPWQLRRTQPMLRGLARVDEVATLLTQAMQALHGEQLQRATAAAPATTRPTPASLPTTAASGSGTGGLSMAA